MTKIEKILMAVLVLAIIGTIVFWKDVKTMLGGKTEITVDDEIRNDSRDKKDKDKKDKDKKDKKDKDEAWRPAGLKTVHYPAMA
jgi:hypothetical protein